jgi:DNA polymerase III alpha subunit
MPIARPYIKQYAIKKYGAENVCSVGLWQTYNPKLALIDAARALGSDTHEISDITKELPNEFDEMSLEDATKEFDDFAAYAMANKHIVDMAYRIVGRVKTAGVHAGGLIISSVPIRQHIPLMKMRDEWVSAWTEGKSTQLSKFGFVKFDMLGLKNVQYMWNAKKLIKMNRDVSVDLESIPLDDGPSLKMASDLKTDSIFQFETDISKSILAKGGVKTFNDLLIYTSLGRPGPMPLIDTYIKRRDDKSQSWRNEIHPKMVQILEDTYGIIVFQEQLQKVWMDICGFTFAESEDARKIIAKKWQDKLPALGQKVVMGAESTLGGKKAEELWESMVTFGRYAFNLAHGTAYTLIAYRTLWLKAHYPTEWWAAVMSDCHRERLVRYIGIAKSEGVEFGVLDCCILTESFTVSGDKVLPGLNSIKGIGQSARDLAKNNRQYKDIDEFIEVNGKGRVILERLIKLGAFDRIHPNRKAIWLWYLFKYQKERETKEIVSKAFAWPENKITVKRQELIAEFRKLHPKRSIIPPKIANWSPKVEPTLNEFLEKFKDDRFMNREILQFEKAHLGFYWTSPMGQFNHRGNTIASAKISGTLECVVEDVKTKKSEKSGNEYVRMTVTDGIETATVLVWGDDLADQSNADALAIGNGIFIKVNWTDKYRSFNIASGSVIIPLRRKSDSEELQEQEEQEAQEENLEEVEPKETSDAPAQ